MTYERAFRGGYAVANKCPLCGCDGDSVFHRVWQCRHPAVVEARERVTPAWLRAEAARRGPSDLLYTKAIIPHPGDVWPKPYGGSEVHVMKGDCAEDAMDDAQRPEFCRTALPEWSRPENNVEGVVASVLNGPVLAEEDLGGGWRKWRPREGTLDGDEDEDERAFAGDVGQIHRKGAIQLAGRLYVDGSCTQNIFKELRRAGASIVLRQPERRVEARMLLPVWRPLPQTAQAAEYLAMVLPYSFIAGEAQIISDCANAVDDAQRPMREALRSGRRYAGLIRHMWASSCRGMVTVEKTRAHVCIGGLEPGMARENALGNDAADEAAKTSVFMHEQPLPTLQKALDAQCVRAKMVIRAVAATLSVFPPMPKGRMARRPVAQKGDTLVGGVGTPGDTSRGCGDVSSASSALSKARLARDSPTPHAAA